MKSTGSDISSDFIASVQGSNPYSVERVCGPDEPLLDVQEIHADQFDDLCELAKEVYITRRGIGAMLMGPVGVGKSHLLSRFCRWAKDEHAFYIYLCNVMASPESMVRHFLRSVISMMVEGRETYKQSPLYRMVNGVVLRSAKKKRPLPSAKRITMSAQEARARWNEAADQFQLKSLPINQTVLEVLYRFFESVNLSSDLRGPTRALVDAMIDWLSGEAISEEMAQQIGLDPATCRRDEEGLIRLLDDAEIEQVLLIICEASFAAERAFLVCLDQFDNLHSDQVRKLAQFLHALIDHARNLLVVTAGVRQTMITFHDDRTITESQWDRVASRSIELHHISVPQARSLVSERLKPIQKLGQSDPQISGLLNDHTFFPLSEKEFERRFGDAIELRPRTIICWARDAWRAEQKQLKKLGQQDWMKQWQGDVAAPPPPRLDPLVTRVDRKIDEAINERIADLREHAGSLPANADNLATLVERLVVLCVQRAGYSVQQVKRVPGEKPSFHLEVMEAAGNSNQLVRTAVAMVVTRDGRSAHHALNRFLNPVGKLDHRILVTDEDRAPLPKTEVTDQKYQELLKLGPHAFQHIKLTFQHYVELDALRSVVDQANDLMIEDPVGEERSLRRDEVIEALHRLDRFRKHPLLKELVTEPTENPIVTEPVFPEESLVRSIIMGELAWKISVTSNHVTQVALESCTEPRAEFELAHQHVLKFVVAMGKSQEVHLKDHLNGKLILSMA